MRHRACTVDTVRTGRAAFLWFSLVQHVAWSSDPGAPSHPPPPPLEPSVCSNECGRTDDECDDGGESSEYTECTLGTDCTDCGVRLLPPPPPPPVDHAKPSRLPEHVERPWWMEFIGRTFFVRGLTPIG